MNEITPAEIIQWQNAIQEKGYSKTYERMIQNQLNALFNHAQKNLQSEGKIHVRSKKDGEIGCK